MHHTIIMSRDNQYFLYNYTNILKISGNMTKGPPPFGAASVLRGRGAQPPQASSKSMSAQRAMSSTGMNSKRPW